MESLYVVIGNRIKSYLDQFSISQKDFAEQIDVLPQVMNKIIQGKKMINAMEIQQIAQALSITANDLIGGI